ncbi:MULTISPECIES: hypothetical protein [unclassified Nocardia]|uniref:hypothetical protein n=1 Tax=unclassified Nocardia TaxID=2637762 RepID=UPI00278C098B|nr:MULTISPECIES: hypothetical protein [unclassified Nocardia]
MVGHTDHDIEHMSDIVVGVVAVGDRVRLLAGGVSVFEVVEVRDDGTTLVQAAEDAPGRYPFPTPTVHLVPADPPSP